MDKNFNKLMCKVSVILPIYNVEKFLSRQIESLLHQSLESIEIIMVDDESPDNCPQLCEEYKRKYSNIKVIHKKNAGLGLARNSGLEVAEGEYVAFPDSDDFVDLEMFKTLYDYASTNQLDACFCGYHLYKDKNHDRIKQEKANYEICDGRDAVRAVLLDMVGAEPSYPSDVKVLSSMWKGIYKREVIENNNLRFVSEREYIAEDIMFHLVFLPCCNKVGFVPQAFYYYCDNGTSLTRTYRADRFDKELFQYRAMDVLMLKNGFSERDYRDRLDRYLFLKLRSCLSQQYVYVPTNGYKAMRGQVKRIVGKHEVREFVHRYPAELLPLKFRLFFWLVKLGNPELLFLLFKIRKA